MRSNQAFKSSNGNLYTMTELMEKIETLETKVTCLVDCITELHKKFTIQDGVLTEDD